MQQTRTVVSNFRELFNLRDESAKGRSIGLFSTVIVALYNALITGIFYTGFLSMYGMSITDAGIITFLPYIGNLFTIFSSRVLARFKRRKPILIASRIVYYGLYIIATNLMPLFVHDPQARLVWFVAILLVAYSINALFTPGFTVWFYNFYPTDNAQRTRYLQYQEILSSIMSSAVLLLSSVLADAVKGSEYQNQLILGLRYFAFVLVLVELYARSRAREPLSEDKPKLQLRKVFTLPMQYPKFRNCMIMMFVWTYLASIPNSVWGYHILNHLNFSYTLINTMTVMYSVILLLTSNLWRKVLNRYSWIKTYGIGLLLWVPAEIMAFYLRPNDTAMFVANSLMKNVIQVGLHLAYANILYLNLPKENATAHIAYNTLGCNLFTFLGLMTGTLLSAISEDQTYLFMGMEIYSVQLICLVRSAGMLALGLILFFNWRSFTPEKDIAAIEAKLRRA